MTSTAPGGVRLSATRVVITAVLVVVLGGALVVAGFASEQTLIGPFVLRQPGGPEVASTVGYVSGLVVVGLVLALAGRLVRRGAAGRSVLGWLVGVSAAGVLFFGWVAVLATGFYSAARGGVDAGEAWATGILFVAAFAGPSIASLVAASLLARAASRRDRPASSPPGG